MLCVLIGAVLHGARFGENFVAVEEWDEVIAFHFATLQPRVFDHSRCELQDEPRAVQPTLGGTNCGIKRDLRAPGYDDEAIGLRVRCARVPGVDREHTEELLGFTCFVKDRLIGEPQREIFITGASCEHDSVEPEGAIGGRGR